MRSVSIDLKPDLILITESWTHEEIIQAFLEIDGFILIAGSVRTDTVKGRGGGLLIYSRNEIKALHLPALSDFNQISSISVPTTGGDLTINL